MSPRKSREIPTLSGVYQIRCIQNGKIYIASAVNLEWRWQSHRRDLRNGVHVNPHLQSAWNRHGETSFEFSVVEYVDETRLLATEQFWIDKTGCTDRQIGFNIKPDATGAGAGVGLTWEDNGLEKTHMTAVASGRGFIAPGGAVVRITNLSAFSRAAGLCKVHMFELKSGKRPSHKGWTWQQGADQAFDEQPLA